MDSTIDGIVEIIQRIAEKSIKNVIKSNGINKNNEF